MMEYIQEIITRLNIDGRIRKLINKEVKIPVYLDDFNSVEDYWYPHPPCLIPLFLGFGASYKGVINHFFCDRRTSYVEYFLEYGHVSEIARNADQLITLMILKMIITKDELTEEIIAFCKQLDYNDYEEVEQFVFDYGDDPEEFKNLVHFKQIRPFKYIRRLSDYDGDFPSSIHILNSNEIVQNSSMFEIAPTEKLGELQNLPWLNPDTDKKALFNHFSSKSQLREAWLTLNAKGWLLKDVADSLEQLKNKADNELFSIVADNWVDCWRRSPFLDGSY